MVKKNTLYFEVRHTIYLFATLIPAVCAVVEAFNPVTSSSFLIALRISLFLQTRDYTVG